MGGITPVNGRADISINVNGNFLDSHTYRVLFYYRKGSMIVSVKDKVADTDHSTM